MNLKKILTSGLCAGLVALVLPVAAGNTKHLDKDYDFAKVKTIGVEFIGKDAALDSNTFKVVEGITYQAAARNIAPLGAKGKALKLNAADGKKCQLKIYFDLKKYQTIPTMISGTNRKLLGKLNIVNQSQHGNSGLNVVIDNVRNEELPAYETETIKVEAQACAVDTATGKIVWFSADEREKTNGNLETTTRGDVYKRILADFWNSFLRVMEK